MRKIKDIWDEYSKMEIMDSRAFVDVYRAKSKANNEYVAIKEIN